MRRGSTLARLLGRAGTATPEPVSTLDRYATGPPTAQTVVDIMAGEWVSELPESLGVKAGSLGLFDDPRITWAIGQFGGVAGKRMFEFGPLEGGHTYMLHEAGASSIVAVEANRRAYLKCLIVKDLLHLDRVTLLCGDAVGYLEQEPREFDACLASGILYHMAEPARLIAAVAQSSKAVFFWTHYYDAGSPERMGDRRTEPTTIEHRGYRYQVYPQRYGQGRSIPTFCGGGGPGSNWLSRETLFDCLDHFGLEVKAVSLEEPDHPGGPALGLVAIRR